MKAPPSIRRTLSRVVVKGTLVWSLAAFGVVWFAVRFAVGEVLDGALQESAEILHGTLGPTAGLSREPAWRDMPPHDEHLVWQVVGPDHAVLRHSLHAPANPLSQGTGIGWSDLGNTWRVYGVPFDKQGAMLYVAQLQTERRRAQLLAAAPIATGALIAGLACAGWLRRRVRHELQPIVDMSRAVAAYHPLEAGSPRPVATREELAPVRDAIVHLGERLASHVASEQAFSANAAHALRTPLAGLGAQLALALRESPPEGRPRIERAREAADRLSRVVTALLALFRSGGEVQRQSLALHEFFRMLPVTGLDLQVNGDATVEADPDLLAAAVLNLLDNSARCGARRVSVTMNEEGSSTAIVLHDDGPGAPPHVQEQLRRALDMQQYNQAMGLGLMLADRIMRAHGGRVSVRPSEAGFAVELRLQTHAGPTAAQPGG